jgi:hypothetical protein
LSRPPSFTLLYCSDFHILALLCYSTDCHLACENQSMQRLSARPVSSLRWKKKPDSKPVIASDFFLCLVFRSNCRQESGNLLSEKQNFRKWFHGLLQTTAFKVRIIFPTQNAPVS